MPEWITPVLWPLWCAATRSSASRTTTDAWRPDESVMAVAMPTIPPPMMATSWRAGLIMAAAQAITTSPGLCRLAGVGAPRGRREMLLEPPTGQACDLFQRAGLLEQV